MPKDNCQELIQIGFSKFIKNNSMKWCSKQTKTTLQCVFFCWQIQDYSKEWQQIISEMRQTQICQIYVKYCRYYNRSNLHRNFIVKISHIKFTNLTILSLPNLLIENIQSIMHIDTSNLKSLNLKNNCISTLRCLAKIDLRKLLQLNISMNKIVELPRMNLLNFVAIARINLDDKFRYPNIVVQKIGVVQNMNWMAKLKNHAAIQYSLQGRIQQKAMKKMLQNNNLSFYK